MTDYKHTLNLPQTSFPMKANLASREPEILAVWQSTRVYQKQRACRAGKPQYILHDGPPYANGRLHVGHALNKILKDIAVKSRSLDGLDAPFVPGWDCHGLPIELNVEKEIGKAGMGVKPADFRDACRLYAAGQIEQQSEVFQRLGVLGDWDKPYRSMDFSSEANIIRALASMVEQGHVVQGKKPVHWCVDCGSALAEAEVEYQDKSSLALDVRFQVLDETALFSLFKISAQEETITSHIPIWTTTAWTLMANEAVALHPKLHYVLVRIHQNGHDGQTGHKECWVLAENLCDTVMQRVGITDYTVLGSCKGDALTGLLLQHPFLKRKVPVVMGDHVTVDAGTGAVHTAPVHGQEDYRVGVMAKLPMNNPVDARGCYVENTPFFAGQHVLKVGDAVLALLQERGALLHAEKIMHSYPHCWRHKIPLIFRATSQWFISMDHKGLRDKALSIVDTVDWMPEWGRARMRAMIANRPDWCISRQRFWGTPIPFFIHKDTEKLHPETVELMEAVATLVEQKGIDAWFELDAGEFLQDPHTPYRKTTDILDVWFESGVTHYYALEKQTHLGIPADLYLEGEDQYRGWFQSALLTAVAMRGIAPFKAVLTHGFTVDGKGRKMSKSLGNIVTPDKIYHQLGADILRLWAASVDYRSEVCFSDELTKRTSEVYRRIRNTARFLLANLHDFQPELQVPTEKLLALDAWLIERARSLQSDIQASYSAYDFHRVRQQIHDFCSIDLGSFYLDIIKDRQYTLPADSLPRRSAQTAMYHVLEALVRWVAPILSFTAEEIWQHRPGYSDQGEQASVFLSVWYNIPMENTSVSSTQRLSQADWQSLLMLRGEVNKALELARSAGVIGSGLAANVTLFANDAWQKRLAPLGDELRFVLITSTASVLPLMMPEKLEQLEQSEQSEQSIPAFPQGGTCELEGIRIHVDAATAVKCERCWHYCENVGQSAEHPTLCERCVGNITGHVEERWFA